MRLGIGPQFFALFVFAGFLPASSSAEVINLGVISFDNLIPGGTSPGINAFDISNFTGTEWSLPPDFPVINGLSFLNSSLLLLGSGSPQTILLGSLVPGLFDPPSAAQFPQTASFTSATFSATLSTPFVQLADGSRFTFASTAVSAVLVPSSGQSLQAGTDLAVISASGDVVTPGVPEPATGTLLTAAFMALMMIIRLFPKAIKSRG